MKLIKRKYCRKSRFRLQNYFTWLLSQFRIFRRNLGFSKSIFSSQIQFFCEIRNFGQKFLVEYDFGKIPQLVKYRQHGVSSTWSQLRFASDGQLAFHSWWYYHWLFENCDWPQCQVYSIVDFHALFLCSNLNMTSWPRCQHSCMFSHHFCFIFSCF